MKTSLIIWISSFIVGLVVSLALANPDMLPKHPGSPMGKSVEPVKGQPLANDPGQTNATGEHALIGAATFDDAHSFQHLSFNQNDQRLLEKVGARILPKVQGPNIKIEPPVKEATKIPASPHPRSDSGTSEASPSRTECGNVAHCSDSLRSATGLPCSLLTGV